MNKKLSAQIPSFLTNEPADLEYSIFKLNLFLNGCKPYTIDYQVLLMSYHFWKGKDLDEFCQEQTISYFLLNPLHDSVEAREAFCLEIREFLTNQ
ncbi:hypothetical protein [Flagellimonas allohymeniacidonis]|uniref:Uncharacterized protein n=1 Tax=Flagellimonas allohymeniacidonis TaxID=2517819 RepID=A0A4Q8QJ12_9FLAO|nr:hypothetical protein [Allomuricauda hymeniacidonis]TAI49278.1 hypothetical protein EW142_05645 [Allomuricauda hymeniacidonis]